MNAHTSRRFGALTLAIVGGWIAVAASMTLGARANAGTGDLDASFGEYGRVVLDLPGEYEEIAAARQHDGKLVIARTDPDSQRIRVVRLNPDGALDTSFGSGGYSLTDFGGKTSTVRAMLAQGSGRLLLAGSTAVEGSPEDLAIVALRSDGSIDDTFGNSGRVVLDLAGGASDRIITLIEAANGDLLLTGSVQTATSRLVVVRLSATGDLQTSFGDEGRLLVELGQATYGHGLVEQPDGRVVACGSIGDQESGTGNESGLRMLVVRLRVDGSLDSTLAQDGSHIGTPAGTTACAVQADGRILVAGTPSGGFALLTRLMPNGEPDESFGEDGVLDDLLGCSPTTCDSAWIYTYAAGVRVLANGSIVVGGIGERLEPMASMLHPDGQPVEQFGPRGLRGVDIGSAWGSSLAYLVGMLADERSIVLFSGADGGSPLTVGQLNVDNRPGASVIGIAYSHHGVEGEASAMIDVRRTGSTEGAVSISYRTVDETAHAGTDYESTQGTLTWNDGDGAIKTVVIPVVDDNLEDEGEYFTLVLEAPLGAGLSTSSATGNIVDTDSGGNEPEPSETETQSGGGGGALGADLALLMLTLLASLVCRCRTRLDE